MHRTQIRVGKSVCSAPAPHASPAQVVLLTGEAGSARHASRWLWQTLLPRAQRRPTTDAPPDGDWQITAGIREQIAMRWERVPLATQRVLSNAAVVGARFNIDVLQKVLPELPAEVVFNALDEARFAGLIEQPADSGEHRSGHVLTRDPLYEQLPALERAGTHERVGTVLETTIAIISRPTWHCLRITSPQRCRPARVPKPSPTSLKRQTSARQALIRGSGAQAESAVTAG
jgi:hypothetical protein